jgi:hypothetical protein
MSSVIYDVPHYSARLDLTPHVEVLPWGSMAMDVLPWSYSNKP